MTEPFSPLDPSLAQRAQPRLLLSLSLAVALGSAACGDSGTATAQAAGGSKGAAPTSPPPSNEAVASKAASVTAAPAQASDRLVWVDKYEDALKRAKKEKKLVLVDFYTDWCGWCKRLDRDVFAADSFQKTAKGIVGVKVNAEKHRELAQQFNVTAYPRLFIVDDTGKTLERIVGYLNLRDFTAKVEKVMAGDTEYERLSANAADPNNVGGVMQFARFLGETGQLEASIPLWQQVHDTALQRLFDNPQATSQNERLHRQALLKLGQAYAAAGFSDLARDHVDELLSTYTGDEAADVVPDALLSLAGLEIQAGRLDEARALLVRIARDHSRSQANRRAQGMHQALRRAASR